MNVSNPIKGLVGSARQKVNPIESIVKNMYTNITIAERNRALVALIELVESNPEVYKGLFVRENANILTVTDVSPELNRYLLEHGLDPEARGIDAYRLRGAGLKKNQIQLWRNGIREVYSTSEALRHGIQLGDALKIIMQSNFSKLNEDGEPIYDERGKVMKGPNYWKPEPKIEEMLKKRKFG